MRRLIVSLVVIGMVCISALGVWAQSQNESTFGGNGFPGHEEGWEELEEGLKGKDFVVLGTMGVVSGSLLTMEGEWFVQTPDELYEIHLGDHNYRKHSGIELEVDKHVVVWGFIYDDDIAVVSLGYADCVSCCPETIDRMVMKGQLEITAGTVRERNGIWLVEGKDGAQEILLGESPWINEEHLTAWTEAPVEVYQLVTDHESLVVALSLAEGTFHFRTPGGSPLWAGQGQGHSRDHPMYRYNGTGQLNQTGLDSRNR